MLYEVITGMTQYELLQRVIHHYPPSPRKLRPRLSTDVETICLKCLSKEPERRYQTAGELADDCRAFLNGEVIKARPSTARITSYNVCYTKLLQKSIPSTPALFKAQSSLPYNPNVLLIIFRTSAVLETSALTRITSYNVCYTKLLRNNASCRLYISQWLFVYGRLVIMANPNYFTISFSFSYLACFYFHFACSN